MVSTSGQRLVIDTNVVFEGFTKAGGASALLLDVWLARFFRPCVSNSLALEYVDVLSRKLSAARWERVKPVLGTLLSGAALVVVHYTWRPTSADPADDHVIDCAMNAGAAIVTWNFRDYRSAERELGLVVASPVEAVLRLDQGKG